MGDKILVMHGASYADALTGLGDFSFDVNEFMASPEDFKLVQFTGGEDVSPSLYNDTSPLGLCHNSVARDMIEKGVFETALQHGIKMAGICRGSQFLNVMSGGRMMHDITGHAGATHHMTTLAGELVQVNSSHHQMSVLGEEGILFGWSMERRSKHYIGREDKPEEAPKVETEALYYPHTKSIGVQYHPEWLPESHEGYQYYHKLIDNFLKMDAETFLNGVIYGKAQLSRSQS